MQSRTVQEAISGSLKVVDLHPSLEGVVVSNGLNRNKLSVALRQAVDLTRREEVLITDGEKTCLWMVPSLRALFRGEKVPPDFAGEPPPEYMPHFMFIEEHVLTFCEGNGVKTDGEFEEVYSNLRRKPDGKSLNHLHFFIWQVAAGLVGKRPVSAAEFDALFGRLTKSARTFSIGLVSRNYVESLRQVYP